MRSEPIGVAVIGLGFMGRTHLESFARDPRCDVRMVIDRDPSRFESHGSIGGNLDAGSLELKADLSNIDLHDDIEHALRSPEIDLICVTTPTPSHCDLGQRVIDAGKHLLVEKPVSLEVSSIERLAAAVRPSSGVIAMPAHCMRFWPSWAWMRDRVRDSSFGAVRRASFVRRGSMPNWSSDFYGDDRQSGGAVVDLHIHDADFILHCFGWPRSVVTEGDRRYVRTNYQFEEGFEVTAEGGWLDDIDAPFVMRASLECDEYTVEFDLGGETEICLRAPDGTLEPRPDASGPGSCYDRQASALIDAIVRESPRGPVTLDDAVATGRLLDAEIASMSRGGVRIEI